MNFYINKGTHYSLSLGHFNLNWNKQIMTREVSFEPSCRYYFDDVDKYDINKLFGFSEGFHHRNSARFGWLYNPNNDKIELHSYCYADGVRIPIGSTYICAISILEKVDLTITITGDLYVFTVNCKTSGHTYAKVATRGKTCKKWGYDMFPYFGGNKTAPHDICITIKK